VQFVGVVQDAGDAAADALGGRHAGQRLDLAAGVGRLHGAQEVAVQAEDLDQDRVVHRLRDGADHLGQRGAALQPVVEVLLALLDQAGELAVGPAAGGDVHDLLPEQVERVVLVAGADPVRDGLARPPHRQRDAQVDVVVVVVLPPREVRRPAGGEAAVEELLLLQGEGGPGRVDGRLAIFDGRRPGRLEVVLGALLQERLDHAEGRGRVLVPARQRDVAGALRAPAVDLQEVAELGQPLAGRAAVGGQRRPDPVGLVRGEDGLQAGRAGRGGQLPQLPVGLHDLGVVALQELGDLARVEAELGAHAVEADVVRQQRVHDLEVDLEGPLVVLARLDEVLSQAFQGERR